jgi:selenocysteine lyase/cysteine desulfurase
VCSVILIVAAPFASPVLQKAVGSSAVVHAIASLNPAAVVASGLMSRIAEAGIGVFRPDEPSLSPVLNPRHRPQKGWQDNLDIGSVAPRIGAVVEALDEWSRLFEASAPTSHQIWKFVRRPGEEEGLEDWEPYINDMSNKLSKATWNGVDDLRHRLSGLLGVNSKNIVFHTSTTRSLDVALKSTAIRPDTRSQYFSEKVFVTPFEHDAELGRVEAGRYFHGSDIEVLEECNDIYLEGNRDDVATSGIQQRISEYILDTVESDPSENKTLLVSHVAWSSGICLPIRDIVDKWENRGKPFRLIVDGAHAVGQMNVTVAGEPDCYIFSGHKWLYGPAALGVLVVRDDFFREDGLFDEVDERIRKLSFESLSRIESDAPGERDATVALDPFVGLSESLSVINDNALDRLSEVRELMLYHIRRHENIKLIEYPAPQVDGIINVRGSITQTYDQLYSVSEELEKEYNLIVKTINEPYPGVNAALRICVPFYLSRSEVLSVCRSLNRVLS